MREEGAKLPTEILFKIFELLPREDLLKSRLVNNEFNDIAQEYMIIPDEELSSILSHFNSVAGIEEVEPNQLINTIELLAQEIKDYSEIYKINFENQFFTSLTNASMLNDSIQIDKAITQVFELTSLRLFLQENIAKIIERELGLYENIKYTNNQQIIVQQKEKLFRSLALVMLGGFIGGEFLLALMSVDPLIRGVVFSAIAVAMPIALVVFMKQLKDLSNDSKEYAYKNQLESVEKSCENLQFASTFFSSYLKMPDEQNVELKASHYDVELVNDHDALFCLERADAFEQEEPFFRSS